MGFARLGLCILGLTFVYGRASSSTPAEIVNNIEHNDRQSVLTGAIDTLSIVRGNAEFHLGPGMLTMFDFGSGRFAAMTYAGHGRFRFAPPNEVERYQLHKFTDSDTLDGSFGKLTIFFTVALDHFPDTAAFVGGGVDDKAWGQIDKAQSAIFDHLDINITNEIIGDLLSSSPGTYFCAYLESSNAGELVFMEDPSKDDLYGLYELIVYKKWIEDTYVSEPFYNQLCGYSPDNDLPSERGIATIDITRYSIESRIEGSGDMKVKCDIHFIPRRPDPRHARFTWYYKNKLISAMNSEGDSLMVIRRHESADLISRRADESGFGLIFDEPLVVGREDSVELVYECRSLRSIYGIYYPVDISSWYPWNIIRDISFYSMSFDCDDYYQVISCGNLVESVKEKGRCKSKWLTAAQINYASFAVGRFDSRTFQAPNLPTVDVYVMRDIPHTEEAIALLEDYGILSSADMLGTVGRDVTNSMSFFTSMLGACPFDTIPGVELLAQGEGQGSPGLIHLAWSTFQGNDIGGFDESFRAHEVAHQWWGHAVDVESYRDTWISEGLSDYCGMWYYQAAFKDRGAFDFLLNYKKQLIESGGAMGSIGARAGPVVMGRRLLNTKSDDYQQIVYFKGAYIFHMIRYLLHDYKTGSDDAFAAFLNDLAIKYKGKIITTEKLRALLEDHAGGDMRWFFDQWVYGTAIPKYIFSSKWEKSLNGKYEVTCHVVQEDVPEGFQMIVPLTILFDDDKYIHLKIRINQPEADIELPLLPYKPKKIIFNTFDAVLCKVDYK